MKNITNHMQIGYFLKRNDICNIEISQLRQELQNLLFEANIVKLTIEHIQNNKLSAFDCAVGDWKCQTRTSMLIDLMQNTSTLNQELIQELHNINHLVFTYQQLLNTINQLTTSACQELAIELKQLSLYTYLNKYHLNYNLLSNVTLLSLCFFTTLQNSQLPIFSQFNISVNKMKALINHAKRELCRLSIDHEQSIAKLHSSLDEQKSLEQIEQKNIQHMTALFPGFKSIFKKMKDKQQSFITKNIIFCACGGI